MQIGIKVYSQQKQAESRKSALLGMQLGRKVESFKEDHPAERLLKNNMTNIYNHKLAKADKLIEALTIWILAVFWLEAMRWFYKDGES